jgi:ribose transport system ATP-binding protein
VAGVRLTPALTARHISKSFGPQRALDDVGISVERGEVHALMGENGSGKSTLIKILAGYWAPAPGARLEVAGRPVRLPLRPGEFRRLGMSFVHQDLGLIGSLSVAENLHLAELATERRWWFRWQDERSSARAALRRVGADLDPRERVSDLPPAARATVAIARSIAGLPSGGGGVLVLDEPGAFLADAERRRLLALVRNVADRRGTGVLLASHDLGEVRGRADRVTVLRDGRNVGTATASVSSDALTEMIVGHAPAQAAASAPAGGESPRLLRVIGLTGAAAEEVSFEVRAGEVLGLTGVAGSGFADVPYLLFGALPARAGRLVLDGVDLDLTHATPAAAIEAGLALVPGDQRRDGSVASLSLAENLMLPVLDRYMTRFGLDRRRMRADAMGLLHQHNVSPGRPGLLYGALSGGNQQKAQLAKWLHLRPRCLLLDEPTRGLDVGARRLMIETIRAAAADGIAVVCATGDQDELGALADRALAFSEGRVVES